MKITQLSILLLILVWMLVPARSWAFPCWGYDDHFFGCSGAGGCEGEESYSTCSIGCVSGSCNNNGGSGECCGNHYYSAVIYPDGDQCGGECSLIRRQMANSLAHVQKRAKGTELSRGASYRLAGLRYVFDRCAHAYAVIVDDATPLPIGGL